MATVNLLLVVVLVIISCCYGQASPCNPAVRDESFVEYVESKNCEVDEKFLNLFTNDEAFNKSILSNPYANVLCIGLMDALTLVPEDMCDSFDPFSEIPNDDFCSSSKLATLQKISNSSVFDKNYTIVKVSSFTQKYCNTYCKDDNQLLCWAFGKVARVAFKHNGVSTTTVPTTAPTTTSTTAPTTQPTDPLPQFDFGNDAGTTKSQQGTPNDDKSKEHVDEAAEYDKDNSKDGTTSMESTDDDKKNDLEDAFEDNNITDVQVTTLPYENGDDDGDGDDDDDDTNSHDGHNENHGEADEYSNGQDNNTVTGDHMLNSSSNSSVDPNKTSAAVPTADQGNHNGSQTQNQDGNSQMSGKDHKEDDGDDDDDDNDDDDVDNNHSIDKNLDNNHVSSDLNSDQSGVEYNDDDDDDGYSYWHFAAILLFILFLGVAGYLASMNRKKVLCVCVCACVRARTHTRTHAIL